MTKQNILYIHTHDSGKVFSSYGYDVPTFNIDKFATDAITFDNAFCASPTCSPSRSSLLTGNYPHTNGMLGLANRGFELNDYHEHLVNILNENGYDTVLCGIQHEYGKYTEHQEGAQKIGYRYDITKDCSSLKEKDFWKWDTENTKSFEKWISSRNKNKPFFASVGYFCTHREYPDVLEEFSNFKLPKELENNESVIKDYKGHLQSLKYLDNNFGKIIECLKMENLYENTIIILTTDHGIAFPKCKCTLYDAGIGVALMMKIPDKNKGIRVKSLVSHVDIVPTLVELCQLDTKLKFDGKDFSGLFKNDAEDNTIVAEVNCHTSYEPMRCIRTNRYKYIRYYDEEYKLENLSNIDNSISKENYILCSKGFEKEMEQFYDLINDPNEKINLINNDKYQDVINEMRLKLINWQKETNDYLLRGKLKFKTNWIVNKPTCLDPKSKSEYDFIKI
ncbi:MAG: sulfatase [Anaerorhabdus sp.]|uniref:sulfatase family protein n=1 Tax=Anaerorhabdus sp. TaxID=1872524 RepID=UPI003A8B1480